VSCPEPTRRGRTGADSGTQLLNALLAVYPVVVSGIVSATVHVLTVPGSLPHAEFRSKRLAARPSCPLYFRALPIWVPAAVRADL